MMMMMLGFERESACCVGPVCCKRYGDSACSRDGGREGFPSQQLAHQHAQE